jgi:hypothetical protein
MQKHLYKLALTVALTLVAGLSARAQTVVHEGFDYPNGTVVANQSGGTGFSAAWANGSGGPQLATNFAGGLSYGSLTTSGGGLLVGGTAGLTTAATPNRALSATFGASAALNPVTANTLWMSFLYLNVNQTTGPLYRQANLGLFQGTSEYLDVGLPNISAANQATVNPNFSLWGANKGIMGATYSGTSPLQSTVSATGATPTFIVMKFVVDATAGTADSVYIWFNPSLDSAPDQGLANITFTAQDLSGINNIRFQGGGYNATYGTVNAVYQVDELNLGYTYGDVAPVPEPTVIGLAAMSGLALLALRRKQQ